MSAYNVNIDGKEYKIEVERKSPFLFTVKVNDRVYNVQIQEEKELREISMIKVGEKEFRVKIDKSEKAQHFLITVNEATFKAELKPPRPQISPLAKIKPALSPILIKPEKTSLRKPVSQVTATKGAVVAPMTGKIVRVNVKVNNKVKEGDVVCILEAMKMENEISAPMSGVIREIYVSEGSSVSEGDVLMVID